MNEKDKFFNVINARSIEKNMYKIFHPLEINDNNKKNFVGEETISHYQTKEKIKYFSKYNSLGYRCDEFISDHKNKKHIIFSGCSETVGEGGPIEDSWSHILYNKINKDNYFSGYFNLAVSGMGHIDIINVILEYCQKYNNPDIIVMMLPSIRNIRFLNKNEFLNIPKNGYYRYSQMDSNQMQYVGSQDHLKKELVFSGGSERYEDIQSVAYAFILKMFETFCLNNNIKLIWSYWDDYHMSLLSTDDQQSLFNNYISIMPSKKEIFESLEKDSSLTLSKKDSHHGTVYHNLWANKFYDKLISGGINE